MSLTYEDRKQTILTQLGKEGKVQVHALAQMLKVSTETIRRDLDRLEKEEQLRKVYGGAVLIRSEQTEAPFLRRSHMHSKEKRMIGKLAASLVKDGETILLDNGTTTLELMRQLKDRIHLTVLTNSVPILNYAIKECKCRIIYIGGEINSRCQAATGLIAYQLLDQFKVNKAFISAGGISLSDGITDFDMDEARISEKMMQQAEEAILVADHSKFGVTTFAKIAGLAEVSMVVTDPGCPDEWIHALKDLDVEIRVGTAE